MHVVLKPFRYAHNGWQIEELNIGDKRDFHPDAIENLIKEGYVAAETAPAPVIAPPIVAPAPKRGRPPKS